MALGVVLWPIKLKNCTFLVEVHLLSFSLPIFGEMSSLDRHILINIKEAPTINSRIGNLSLIIETSGENSQWCIGILARYFKIFELRQIEDKPVIQK